MATSYPNRQGELALVDTYFAKLIDRIECLGILYSHLQTFLTFSIVESVLGGFPSTLYIPSGDNYLQVHFSMILV